MHSVGLFSNDGNVLVSVAAALDDKDECIFVEKENSDEKYLLFRSTGSFRYIIQNHCKKPIYFKLEDSNGYKVNCADYLAPQSSVNLHHHSTMEKLLEFEVGEKTVSEDQICKEKEVPFKFTVFNVSGKWKLHENQYDSQWSECNGKDETDSKTLLKDLSARQSRQKLSEEDILNSTIGKLKLETPGVDVTYEISEALSASIDLTVSSSFTFHQIFNKSVVFLSHEPSKNSPPQYVEHQCCICLEIDTLETLIERKKKLLKEEDFQKFIALLTEKQKLDFNELQKFLVNESLCVFLKCGHKCTHYDCFMGEDNKPNFKTCPLCRSNIQAVIPY